MSDTRLDGGCFCGAVRYRCGTLLYPPTFCHCESCRRVAGAHVVAWLTVRTSDLEFLGAAPVEYLSSPGVHRTFCGRCGTPLTYRRESRDGEIDVTVGSLDRPGSVTPLDHIWMEDALAWDEPGDGRARYPRARP
jgi:hypothetical protein